ncbi:putative WW domain-containing oxidoreductase [Mycena metata]|uniref:WW domain-containing oxidoreductase n=1 Tax=Mycena metata TaxID=1033252 RepID=A0AAD7H8Y9_9AGAR|nr:putative WW domain-containing oxidoreductase [Mycena metata]
MGQTLSFFRKFFGDQMFAKPRGTDTYEDLTGRTFLVTGSNTGIGFALATHLACLQPAQLILAMRDLKKGEVAKDSIIAQTGFKGALEVWELDMVDFASIKRFAERANTNLKRLDGANLNAGINNWNWAMTADGWERM